jgi:hypothetical protein
MPPSRFAPSPISGDSSSSTREQLIDLGRIPCFVGLLDRKPTTNHYCVTILVKEIIRVKLFGSLFQIFKINLVSVFLDSPIHIL